MDRNRPGFENAKVQGCQLLVKDVWDEKPGDTSATTTECSGEPAPCWQCSPHTVQIHEGGDDRTDNESGSEQDFQEHDTVGVRPQTFPVAIRIRLPDQFLVRLRFCWIHGVRTLQSTQRDTQ